MEEKLKKKKSVCVMNWIHQIKMCRIKYFDKKKKKKKKKKKDRLILF